MLPYLAAGASWPKLRIPEKIRRPAALETGQGLRSRYLSENISDEGNPNGLVRRVGGRRENLYPRYTERCRVR